MKVLTPKWECDKADVYEKTQWAKQYIVKKDLLLQTRNLSPKHFPYLVIIKSWKFQWTLKKKFLQVAFFQFFIKSIFSILWATAVSLLRATHCVSQDENDRTNELPVYSIARGFKFATPFPQFPSLGQGKRVT